MIVLLFLFIAVPAVELALLIEIGSRIGTLPTLGLIAITGIVGASLARMQGLAVLRRVQADMSRGELPASALVDGVILLLAGALLITPGILTDAFGFLCLIPVIRSVVKRRAWDWIRARIESQQIHVHIGGIGSSEWPQRKTQEPVYHIEPEDTDRQQH